MFFYKVLILDFSLYCHFEICYVLSLYSFHCLVASLDGVDNYMYAITHGNKNTGVKLLNL